MGSKLKKGEGLALVVAELNEASEEASTVLQSVLKKGEVPADTDDTTLAEVGQLIDTLAEAEVITEDEQRACESVIEDAEDALRAADEDDEDVDVEDEDEVEVDDE